MKRRRKLRRIFKWTGVALCVAMFSAFTISVNRVTYWQARGGRYRISLAFGTIGVCYRSDPVFVGDRFYTLTNLSQGNSVRPGWVRSGSSKPVDSRWFSKKVSPTRVCWRPEFGALNWDCRIIAPIWMPFSITIAASVILFWLDRRRTPPGHCKKCGYNLTGNVSGVCPECGRKCKQEEGKAA